MLLQIGISNAYFPQLSHASFCHSEIDYHALPETLSMELLKGEVPNCK